MKLTFVLITIIGCCIKETFINYEIDQPHYEVNILCYSTNAIMYRKTKQNQGKTLTYLALTLIIASNDVNPNPGPESGNYSTIYPCGTCDQPVTWEQRAVICDTCNQIGSILDVKIYTADHIVYFRMKVAQSDGTALYVETQIIVMSAMVLPPWNYLTGTQHWHLLMTPM